jgi:hypothetical protein
MPTPPAESVPSVLELLSACANVSPDNLARLNLAGMESGKEMGEFLYRDGGQNPQLVRGAIICQLYVLDKMLTREEAENAMRVVGQNSCTIEEALDKIGWPRAYYENVRHLRDLLLASGLINDKQKSLAYATCFPFQVPFLAALVQRQALTAGTADYVLSVQYMILKEGLPFEEAVDMLGRSSKPDGKMAKPELATKPAMKLVHFTGARLGELLLKSTIINQVQLIAGVEEGRRKGQLVGETLVEQGTLTEVDLKRALNAQGRVQNGNLTVAEAIAKLDPKRFIDQQPY